MSEYTTVPARRNIVHDPRPVGMTYIEYVAGASGVYSTAYSYSGAGSPFVTVPGDGSVWMRAAPDDDADVAALSGAGTLYGSFRVTGVTTGGMSANWQVRYTDGSSVYGATTSAVPVTGADNFLRVDLTPYPLNAAKTVRSIFMMIYNPAGSPTQSFSIGGFDISKDQAVDSFVHGDAGPDYSWEGAANNSPSQRKAFVPAPIFGHGGQITYTMSVAVVTRKNVLLRDITSHFLDGSVTYDLDADQWKGTCNLTLNEPGLVEALADEYVRITLHIDYADGTSEEGSLGMFMMDPPKERWQGGFDTWSYSGRDLLALLASQSFRGAVLPPDPLDGPEGESTVIMARMIEEGKALREVLLEVLTSNDPVRGIGLDPSQVAIPASFNAVADDIMGWEGGTDALTIVSDILQAGGWQKPWVTPVVTITSAPAGVDPATVTPSISLATGENSQVRWPFEVDPDATAVGNRVRVVSARSATGKTKKKKGSKNVAVEVWATNEDPSHPISYQRLGRWVDIPDIKVPLVANEGEAQQLAKQALIDAGQLPIRARLTTQAMLRNLNEVYELNLLDAYGDPIPSGQGRYWCRGWSIQLGPPWEQVHNLSRVIAFGQASFLKVQGS